MSTTQRKSKFRDAAFRFLKTFSQAFRIVPSPVFSILWNASDLFDGRLGALVRYVLLAGRLKSCGVNVFVGRNVSIVNPENVSLGSDVSIHHGCTLLASGPITIGDSTAIAHGSSLVSGEHSWEDESVPIKYNTFIVKSVVIERDVWIGCGVRILGGASIGTRTVVAAGAVVKGIVPSRVLFAGVPGRVVKPL